MDSNKLRTFLWSLDSDIFRKMQTSRNGLSDLHFEICTDVISARNSLESPEIVSIFIDLREKYRIDGLHELCAELLEINRTTADVFSFSNSFIDKELAKEIELLTLKHLKFPLDPHEIRETWEFISQGGRKNGSRVSPRKKNVETDDMKIVTYCPKYAKTIEELLHIAQHNVTILLIGETGTGKTTWANTIHKLSKRCQEPFQTVACGALPRELIESELFGHMRGSFTGAERSKIGRFEAAGRGTILLDEIEVLGPAEQAKLLRVIESGEFEPVGSNETRKSNARVIVASNVDLETLAATEQFRADLYYRLNVLQFRIPPLKERTVDIVPISMQFIDECGHDFNIPIEKVHSNYLSTLKNYSWPGNLRELKNQVQRSVIFSKGGVLTKEDLSDRVQNGDAMRINGFQKTNLVSQSSTSLADRVAETERVIVEEALDAHQQSRTATAKSLGISRVGLYKKMRKLGMT